MSVRVRFAPSPTGFLHVGGARTALYNYLFARRNGGTFILRIEDTDAARSTDESVSAILEGLRWLGLEWDEGPQADGSHGPYFQSQRRERYAATAEQLLDAGLAYRCYCAPEELEERRRRAIAEGGSAGYDGRCRTLNAADRAAMEATGRPAAIRFHVGEVGEVVWEDVVKGRIAFQSDVLDDFVILRADGHPTYNFAAVVDDHAMDITHVIRGDDHVSNTPRQIVLYRALQWEPPAFAHVPMILGDDGQRLSKRHGATAVGAYGDLGYLPQALVNFLVLLGWSLDGERELFTLAELERVFELERVGSNPAVFNTEKLTWMNGQYVNALSPDERVALALAWLGDHGWDLDAHDRGWWRALILALGERFKTFAEIPDVGAFALEEDPATDPAAWSSFLERVEVAPRLKVLAERLEALPAFELEPIEATTRGLASELGIKAGELMGAVRVALTRRATAPGLFDVMWLLGRERTVARLRESAARWERESPHAHV